MERKVTIILLVAVTALIVGGCKRERVNLPPNAPVVSVDGVMDLKWR